MAKDLGITRVVVVVLLYLSLFIEVKKILLHRESNRGPLAPSQALYQLSHSTKVTLTIESYLFNVMISKTP